MAKGGSKILTGVIAFFLGFLFAIVVEIGAVFGVYYYVSNTEIDTLLSNMGLENKDADGNYIYINTDKNNGGAEKLGDLLTLLKGYIISDGSSSMDYPVLGKSLDEIYNLLPVTQKLLAEKLYPTVSAYVDIDWETFESKPISEIPEFLSECVDAIRPAKILSKLGMDDLVGEGSIPIVRALLAGCEFTYARGDDGKKFPVYYDNYTYNASLQKYFREESVDNKDVYPSNLSESLLYKTNSHDADGNTLYRLYYFPCSLSGASIDDADVVTNGKFTYADETVYIALQPNDGEFTYKISEVASMGQHLVYLSDYGANYMNSTGNYYYTNADNEVQVDPVTIGSIADKNKVFKPLYGVPVTDLISGGGDNKVIKSVFGKTSVGELLSGEVDFDKMISELELAAVMNINPDSPVMAYIGYGLTNVSKVTGDLGYQRVGYVDIDGVSTKCYIRLEEKANGDTTEANIAQIWYYNEDGEQIDVKGTTVSGVSKIVDGLEITALMKVKADDAILSYLGYGAYGVTAQTGEGYTHVGKTDIDGSTKQVFINTDAEKNITAIWYNEGGEKINVGGTTVNGLNDRLNGVMDHISITDFMDVQCDNAIMAYIGYGATGVRAESGNGYTHVGYAEVDGVDVPCFITADADKKITEIYYMKDGVKTSVQGATINQVSDRVGKITDKLTLPDVIDVNVDDAIMGYMGYGLTSVRAADGEGYNRVAYYKADGVNYPAFVKVEDGKAVAAWYEKDGAKINIVGTKIGKISDRIASLTDDLTLGDVIEVNADDSIMAYIGYGLTNVRAESGEGYNRIATYKVDGVAYDAFVNVDNGKVIDAWYVKDGANVNISGTVIGKIPDVISSLSENLTLPDVLDVTAENTVTAYLGYGVTHIGTAEGHEYSHVAKYKVDDQHEFDCFIETDPTTKKITSVWYMDGSVKKYVSGTPISKIPEKVDGISTNLTLGDVMDVTEDDAILWALKDEKIANIGSAVKTLKIKDVLAEEEINKSNILKQLADRSIDEMPTAIDDISIQSIYAKEIYGLAGENLPPEEVFAYQAGVLYFEEVDGALKYVHEELTEDQGREELRGVLTEEEFNAGVAAGKKYFTHGKAMGMWRLILFKDGHEKLYTLNNFNNMINCCTSNINEATLNDLQEAGIIQADPEKLNKDFVWYTKEYNVPVRHSQNLGKMKLRELIDAVINMDLSGLGI